MRTPIRLLYDILREMECIEGRKLTGVWSLAISARQYRGAFSTTNISTVSFIIIQATLIVTYTAMMDASCGSRIIIKGTKRASSLIEFVAYIRCTNKEMLLTERKKRLA